jgi:toxin ParE1/3/4
MARRLIWTKPAQAQIRGIAEYISIDSPAYARNVVRRIVEATRRLPKFPECGRPVDFHGRSLREVIAQNYRVIYEVGDEQILIIAVIHGRQLLER